MSIKKKICIILLMISFVLVAFNFNGVFAATPKKDSKTVDLKTMESEAYDFINAGKTSAKEGKLDSIATTVSSNFKGLGQILTFIGAGVLVIVVSYMGIKYLISPPDKQAALKQQLIGVVVSGIVIFGAYGIWSAILKVVSQF